MAYLGRKAALAGLTSSDIPDNSITSAKIVDGAVAVADLGPDSVDSSELVDGSVDLSHMSANSVDSDQYVDGSIDNAHLADDAVGIAELSATGTPTNENFLRGDNSWVMPAIEGEGYVKSTTQAIGAFLRADGDNTSSWYSGGQVLQTVKYNNGEQTTCTSQSFNTSDVVGGATITPISATSDILLFGQVTVHTNSTAAYVYVDFYKNASDFTETANLSGQTGGLAVNGHSLWLHCFITWLDVCSENSTSEKTYKISCRNNSPGGTSYLGWGSASQNIIIMQEIAR